jgi:hypothetical protein
MRYKRNPYEGLREHDIEHRELLARLRAAADTLKSFNVLDPRDPKFQALLPEAALNWPNRELRQAVEKAESDVKFYADFFQKRNPRRRNPDTRRIVVAWVIPDGAREIVPGEWERSWDGSHHVEKTRSAPKALTAMWLNEGSAADIKAAKHYAATERPPEGATWSGVFDYPSTEKDPLGRAKKDALLAFVKKYGRRNPFHRR